MNASFDFTKYLSFLETKGRDLYNPNFKVHAEDYEIIFKLLIYFLKDESSTTKYNLSGPVGCDKTSLMNLIELTLPQE